jgi:hypothetical protein
MASRPDAIIPVIMTQRIVLVFSFVVLLWGECVQGPEIRKSRRRTITSITTDAIGF